MYLWDLSILFAVFDDFLKCPECGQDVTSHVDVKQKHGYSHCIILQCTACEWKYCFKGSLTKLISEQSFLFEKLEKVTMPW